jgi:hypothetical protein
MDSLLPIPDPSEGADVPSYQVYLALAWFRCEGILRQHGRVGYSLLVTANLENTLNDRWDALPQN